MSWWGRVFGSGQRERDGRIEALQASVRMLTRDLRSMQGSLEELAGRLASATPRLEQLAALRAADADAPARLDRLAAVLDAAHITAHMRQAIRDAALIGEPVPFLDVRGLWPDQVFAAAMEAVPAPVFFEDGSGDERQVRVPPALAPLHAVATWNVLAPIMADVLVPEAVARFEPILAPVLASWRTQLGADTAVTLAAEPGRLVLRSADIARRTRVRPSHVLTVSIFLGPFDSPAAEGAKNRAVVTPVGSAPAGAPGPASNAAPAGCYYEFEIGADKTTARRMNP